MRLRFMFWLDLEKQEEYQLAEVIEDLKERRTFVSVIRDGIRLVNDLRMGQVDVLCELFPWIPNYFSSKAGDGGNGSGGSEEVPQYLQEQLKQIEHLIMRQGAQPIPQGAAPSQLPARVNDSDIAAKLDVKKSSGGGSENPTYNMLISNVSMGMLPLTALKADILEYGLAMGRFGGNTKAAEKLLRERKAKAAPLAAKPLAGASKPLTAPNVDDLDLALLGS